MKEEIGDTNIIDRIIELLQRDWTIAVVHTLIECNKCTDILRNLGFGLELVLHVWNTPHPSLSLRHHFNER
ncbi:ribonuclease H [Senna tora]|uniref:Ribonuclease H n=1 Tax=Senna tora TaxID=362788 RepID=A0A834SH71_9FABA|nr:ribonuclease H [Senna tora]